MPSNILYLHETSKLAGAEYSLIQLAKNLDRSCFNPIFILPDDGPFANALKRLGIVVHFIEFPKVRHGIWVLNTMIKLRGFIRENNIALIHSNSIRTNVYGALTARLMGIPSVWHERNLITTEHIDPDRVLSFLPDAIVCNSHAISQRFAKNCKLLCKIRVIHNGVDISAFCPSVSGVDMRRRFEILPDETVIGIASRFNSGKGHEIFFQSAGLLIKSIARSGDKVRFLVVGGSVFDSDKYRESLLKEFVRKESLDDNVIFAGVSSEMPGIYAAMDIVVLASYAEPCGRVVSEAMAMGKPVVATNTGGTSEMVVDGLTGMLIPPRDPVAMAEALRELLNNKKKRLSMGCEGRKRAVECFDIKNSVRYLEDLYDALISKKGIR